MKRITLILTDEEFDKLNLKTSIISFKDLVRKIKQIEIMNIFKKVNANAKAVGFDKMTDEEIDSIIK